MAAPYATADDLADWLPEGRSVPTGAERLLERASEHLDSRITRTFAVDPETGLPTDAGKAAALRKATCAQVEFWIEVGEENAIDGLAGTQVSAGSFSGRRAPADSPRALDALRQVGLL